MKRIQGIKLEPLTLDLTSYPDLIGYTLSTMFEHGLDEAIRWFAADWERPTRSHVVGDAGSGQYRSCREGFRGFRLDAGI